MLLGCPECAGAVQNPENFLSSSIVSAWGTYVYALDKSVMVLLAIITLLAILLGMPALLLTHALGIYS